MTKVINGYVLFDENGEISSFTVNNVEIGDVKTEARKSDEGFIKKILKRIFL